TKKQRGNMNKIVPRLISDYIKEQKLNKEEIWLIRTPGLSEEIIKIAEQAAYHAGVKKVTWVSTGGVITCHGGPGAFGIAGLSK
ncbi:MAG: fatty acid-binding protein DegV, partial [Muricoprocola sp.]